MIKHSKQKPVLQVKITKVKMEHGTVEGGGRETGRKEREKRRAAAVDYASRSHAKFLGTGKTLESFNQCWISGRFFRI